MKDFDDMSADDLGRLLVDLRADLEDIEEERAFVLGQTGAHVSASTVVRYESEREALREKIKAAEATLAARSRQEE
jgi:hypothetical protein